VIFWQEISNSRAAASALIEASGSLCHNCPTGSVAVEEHPFDQNRRGALVRIELRWLRFRHADSHRAKLGNQLLLKLVTRRIGDEASILWRPVCGLERLLLAHCHADHAEERGNRRRCDHFVVALGPLIHIALRDLERRGYRLQRLQHRRRAHFAFDLAAESPRSECRYPPCAPCSASDRAASRSTSASGA
jgi:hypothetical protein